MPADFLRVLHQRVARQEGTEHRWVAVRIALVSAAMLYVFSDWVAFGAEDPQRLLIARGAVSISFGITLLLAIAFLVNPRPSATRRILRMLHDIAAVSAIMYLGEDSTAAAAALFFWVTLGNGFRYGNAYLYACAGLSFAGFAAVVWFSPYWREQLTLSLNILILLALIPPYVAGLLKSLHKAKAQLRHQASVDALTGLLNRAAIEMSVERILDSRHDGHALLFCDLDLFKKVNDVAGHAAGDKLLEDVARIIRDCARPDDLSGRIGGDEFCVFLKDGAMERARRVAENIRNSVSGYRLAWGTQYYKVGISIGAAPSGAVQDMASLFRLADAACYAAKNAGRNQVHIVNPQARIDDTQQIRKLFSDNAVTASGRLRMPNAAE